jgi:hypothetical protein
LPSLPIPILVKEIHIHNNVILIAMGFDSPPELAYFLGDPVILE